MAQLDPVIDLDGERVGFEVERVRIEPFNLSEPTDYDLVIDRLTHWFSNTREWIKKAVILDDLYVFNNPWSGSVDGEADHLLRHDAARV